MRHFSADFLGLEDDGLHARGLCSFGGGGGGTTQTVQKADPWEGQQPMLRDIYAQAQAMDKWAVPQYFPGETYAGLTPTQQGLMGQIIGYGSGGGSTGLQAANSSLTNMLSPGYTAGTSGAFQGGQGYLSSILDPRLTGASVGALDKAGSALSGAAGILPGAMANYGAGADALGRVASPGTYGAAGSTFGSANDALGTYLSPDYLDPFKSPGFGSMMDNTLARVLPAVNSSFIGGNRTGSGLATRAATMAGTDAVGQLALGQYNANVGAQQAAVRDAASNYKDLLGLSSGAASGLMGGGIAGGGLGADAAKGLSSMGLGIGGMQLGGSGQAANNFLTQQGNQVKGASVAPIVDQTGLGNLSAALQASGMSQTDAQNRIAAEMARYNYGQMLPWNQLGLYQNAIQGGGSPGSTTTTQQPYFNNTAANVMSGVSTAASLALAAATIFSDRRLKTDIERIGESNSGFPLYTFRYKGEPPMSRHIGLMAQDVKKKRPGAIVDTPIGMAVNYDMALAA